MESNKLWSVKKVLTETDNTNVYAIRLVPVTVKTLFCQI